MTISWFEIIAQIINFFIILFILQKLLYKPVLEAMRKRQERIQESQKEADEKMENANGLIDQYDGKIKDIQKEKRQIFENARIEASDKKEELLEGYKIEAENKRRAYLKEVEDEKENFINNLRKNLGSNAVKIAAHILNSISSKALETEIFDTFILSLKELNQKISDQDIFKEESVEIVSFRNLSQDEKKTLEYVLKDQMKSLKEINYKTDDKLILGYELNLQTYTVHGNIKNYLSEIENDIIKNLEIN
jgi:ATP synthase F0 subunit b